MSDDKAKIDEQDMTQISLGRFRVGITGLKAAIAEVKGLQGASNEEIAQALMDRLRPRNYIPAAAREEYRQAFLREFRKAMGEQVDEGGSGLRIRIVGPGCPACDKLEQTVMAVLEELGLPAEVEHVRDVREIARLRIFAVPALLINEEAKSLGQSPTRGMLKQWLIEASRTK